MVGIVVVSHSRPLADAAVELALQMAAGRRPPIEVAAGLDDGTLGTDANRVRQAIERVASADGVLVLMDLGSAVLSAELALELRGDRPGLPVVLSGAPLVEGLVGAVALSAAGAPLAEVAAEAARAGQVKPGFLGGELDGSGADAGPDRGAVAAAEVILENEHGLHARPAARLVETVRGFDADVRVRDLAGAGPDASARSVSALCALGARAGHRLELSATGPQAEEALAAAVALVRRNFDLAVAGPVASPGLGASAWFGASPARAGGPMAASPGIGLGPKTTLGPGSTFGSETTVGAASGRSEAARLAAALAAARADLAATRDRVARSAGEPEAQIFDAELLLLDDDQLTGRAAELLEAGEGSAPAAWQAAVAAAAEGLERLPDPYQRGRAADVRAVGEQVLAHLRGAGAAAGGGPSGVVVAADLTPAQAAGLDPARVQGVVTASGAPDSHAAILLRSLGIPAVGAGGEGILDVEDGTTVLVDGTAGAVVVDPAPEVASRYRAEAARARRRAAEQLRRAGRPATTSDGVAVEVAANIASRHDAAEAVRCGADAVGLLRTELLFLERSEPPSEAEQLAAYRSIAEALGGRRLTIRTLDVGGDKPLAYLPAPVEGNPFLGCRGLRLSLRRPEVLEAQLRAVVRTALDHPVSVLFPMVTTVDELRAARALLAAAAAEVGGTPQLPERLEVGAMVEVPGFALRAGVAAPLVDFMSIGSNDLTQYALAAERGNPAVAALADPLDPAVLRLVAEVVGSGTRVAVCGEAAADPAAAVVLVGLGVRELSMAPPAIPAVKDTVRAVSLPQAAELAGAALRLESAGAVRALLRDHLAPWE